MLEVAPPRAEPLSFLTLETVEGIVGSTDVEAQEGQTSWESRMDKFISTEEKAQGLRTREKRDSNTKVREEKARGRKDLH